MRVDTLRRTAAAAMILGAFLLAAAPFARAAEAPTRPRRAIGYTMYDDDFLFFAARVDDVAITGANASAMSEPWRDDSVDILLDRSGVPSDAINPDCGRISISAASGFSCLVGSEAGTWKAQPAWLMGLKLAVEREGTLNRSQDRDVGYTVELGIPWKFLGGVPQPGARIGFNFVVNIRGENDTFVSWSSRVTTQDDLDRPRLWGNLVIGASARPSVAENDVVICPRVYRAPLVDGVLKADEWLAASVVQLQMPAAEITTQPVTAGKPGARLLATYRYDYQPLSPRPGADAAAPPPLVDEPPDGIGPWFTTDSVAWHKAMLRQAREAAIDTILPVYRGDPAARRTWSRLGLLRLVEALKQTKDERLSYPLVAMYLDASSLASAGAADLTTSAGKQALCDAVAEFFGIVPDEFRAQFDIGQKSTANLLVLGPPWGIDNWDAGFVDACRSAHQRAFGARLIILGDEGWRAKAPNLDGYCSLKPGVAMSYGKDGPRPVVRLSPGYVGADTLLPRHGGQTYEQNWMKVLAVLPDFVIIDSLNDFEVASEIANSRQWGVRFLDITRESAQLLAGRREYQVTIRRETLPSVFAPGVPYQIELLVENQGFEDLTDRQNVEISYTLRNKARAQLQRTGIATPRLLVLAGQRAPIVVDVSTRLVEGPLPPGDYSLSFEVTKSTISIFRSKWFAKHLLEVSLPVRIANAAANRATVLSTGMPSAMGAGDRRRVRLRLRNDGSRGWNAKNTALAYHWVRVPGPGAAPGAQPEIVEWEGVRTPLPQKVDPGRMISMFAWVEARKADGTPLPAWSPDADWSYQLQWDVVQDKDQWFSRAGGETYNESVAVLSSDLGGTIVNADVPGVLEAGKTYQVKVLLRNDGSAPWDPQRVHVSYHWYYWDGGEAAWEGPIAQLPASVGAGESEMLTAQVTAPDFAGSYRLAWDMVFDDRFASEILDAGSRTLLEQPVAVTGGALEALDISAHLNVLAATHDSYRGRGSFDAAGFSLPAEFIPPDTSAGVLRAQGAAAEVYPGIYYGGALGWGSLARIPLRYPAMDQRGSAAAACAGQEIPLPKEPLRAIYIAASASSATDAEFRITYADGTSEAAILRVPSWTSPLPDVPIAVRAPFVRGTADDVQKPAAVYLLRIGDLSRTDPPAALVLPAAPDIKVFAVTVERAAAASAGGS